MIRAVARRYRLFTRMLRSRLMRWTDAPFLGADAAAAVARHEGLGAVGVVAPTGVEASVQAGAPAGVSAGVKAGETTR